MSEFILGDCLEYMRKMPNNAYDLAIVDPPYGIGVGSMTYTNGVAQMGSGVALRQDYTHADEWDIKPPQEYFTELLRVSKKQVVWGG